MDERTRVKQIAIRLIKKDGLINLTRVGLCAQANIPDGSFVYVMGETFGTFADSLRSYDLPRVNVSKKRRTSKKLRRDHILKVAKSLDLAHSGKFTRAEIAKRAGVSESLISRYFSTMKQLRRAISRS